MSNSNSNTAEASNSIPQKKGFLRPPKPLNEKEKKNAKIALIMAISGILAFLLQMIYFLAFDTSGDWLCVLIYWISFIMPAYLTNAGMLIWGAGGGDHGKVPMDFGKNFKDGRRLFGDGKTWRGFFGGTLGFGIPIALFIHAIFFFAWPTVINSAQRFMTTGSVYKFYENNPANLFRDLAVFLLNDPNAVNANSATWAVWWNLLPRVVLNAFGAAFGDLIAAFLKRRVNIPRGQPFWIVDQLDFLCGALLFSGWWVFPYMTFHVYLLLLVITPTITVVANNISYWTGHKPCPW
jgi:CDP-2,3-bis-(O-geranylgeranyl)-sn-glycerol synthase